MKKILVTILLLLSACSKNSSSDKNSSPDLFLEAKSGIVSGTLDIGEISTGSKIVTVTIKNNGTEPLTGPAILDNQYFSFIPGYDCNKSLAKGASCSLKLNFSTSGKSPGEYLTNLNFDSVFATLKAIIPVPEVPTSIIDLQTDLLDFGTVLAGNSSAIKTLTIKNISSNSLLMESIIAPSGFTVNYDGCSGKSIAKNSSCVVKLTYTAGTNILTSELQTPFNYMGDSTIFKVSINNPNLLPPTEPGGEPIPVNPSLVAIYNNLIVSEVNYGILTGSSSSQAIIYIKNNGQTTTPSLNFSLDNNAFSIAYNQCNNTTLAKNSSCQIRIIFSASGKSGSYSSVLSGNGLNINLVASVTNNEIITYRGVYTSWSSCSAINPCDGIGLQNRILNNCEKIINGIPSGQMVSLSYCPGLDTASYVQQNCSSPSGPYLVSIAGGEQTFQCNAGEIQPNFISVTCNSGYTINGQICKANIVCNSNEHVENEICVSNTKNCSLGELPWGASTGHSNWITNSGWSSCVIDSCDSNRELTSGSCICSGSTHDEGGFCLPNERSCSPNDVNASGGTQIYENNIWGNCIPTGCIAPSELALDGKSCESVTYSYNPVFSNFTSCSATACMGQGEKIRTVDFCERVRNGIPTGELEPASANCINQVSSNDLVMSCPSPSGQIPVVVTGGEKIVSCIEGSTEQNFVSIDCFENGFTIANNGQSCQSTSIACSANQIYLNGSCQIFNTTSNITYSPVVDAFDNITEPYNLVYPTNSMAFDMYNSQYQFDQVSSSFTNLFTNRIISEIWGENGPQYQYQQGCFANLNNIDDMYGSGIRSVACQSFGGTVEQDLYGANEICVLPATEIQCQQLINDLNNKVINTAIVSDCFYDYGGMSYCSGWKVNSSYPWLATASGVSSGNQIMKGNSNSTYFVKVNEEGFYITTSYQYFLFKPVQIKVSVIKLSNGQKSEFYFSDIKPFANMLIDPKDTVVFNNQIYIVGRVQANVYNGVESTFIIHRIDPVTLTQTKVVQQSFTDGFTSTNYYANRTHYIFMKDNELQWVNHVWGSANIPTNSTLVTRYRLPLSGTSPVTAGSITYQDAQYLHMGYTNPLPSGSGFVRAETLLNQSKNLINNNLKIINQTIKANITINDLSNNQQIIQSNQDVSIYSLLSGHNFSNEINTYQVKISGEWINIPNLWVSNTVQSISRTQDMYGYGNQTFNLSSDLIKSVLKVSEQRILIVGTKLQLIATGSEYNYGSGRISEARVDDWQYKLYNLSTQEVEETFTITNYGTRILTQNQIDNGELSNIINGNDESNVLALSSTQSNNRFILFSGYGNYGGYSYRLIDIQSHTLKNVLALGGYDPMSEGLISPVYLFNDNIYYVKTALGYTSCSSGMIDYGNGSGCDASLYKLSALNPEQNPVSVPVVELNNAEFSGNGTFRIYFFKDRLLVKVEGYNGFGGNINSLTDYALPNLSATSGSSFGEVEECIHNAYTLFNTTDILKGPLSYSSSTLSGLYCLATGTNGSTLFKLNW